MRASEDDIHAYNGFTFFSYGGAALAALLMFTDPFSNPDYNYYGAVVLLALAAFCREARIKCLPTITRIKGPNRMR